ncbi:hypothetical protein K0U27_01800 [archaeon]|nr:hypothetical protein [archaeon]
MLKGIPANLMFLDAHENRNHDTREKMMVTIMTAMALVVIPSAITSLFVPIPNP